jgi:hypothetical protein
MLKEVLSMKRHVKFSVLFSVIFFLLLFLVACTSPKTDLTGVWLASYPGGPLKVKINQSAENVVATLIDGNAFVPAGKETFYGKFHPDLFEAQQVCASPGFQNPYLVKVMIKIIDNNHFVESLATGSSCGGFPVDWVRMK